MILNNLPRFLLSTLLSLAFICCKDSSGVNNKADTSVAQKDREPATGSHPDLCRYQCYRLGFESDEIADDLTILSSDTYEVLGQKGRYSYNAATGMIRWLDGPLHQPTENWVGVFTPKGNPTGKGGTTKTAIIEIRRMKDVEEGNLRVLQNCACAD